MGKIQVLTDKKTGQVRYSTILPKDVMEDLAAQHGDQLLLKSVVGNEVTFKFKRKE
jgi:hypothetical protein